MLSIEEIEKSILELEQADTSFAVCEKLCWLYVVRDHLRSYSPEAEKALRIGGNSEFLKTIEGKNQSAVWAVIDDLMTTVKALHPKTYAKVLQKIKNI